MNDLPIIHQARKTCWQPPINPLDVNCQKSDNEMVALFILRIATW
nr:hypothetical protein [uncultured Duganella sp.]